MNGEIKLEEKKEVTVSELSNTVQGSIENLQDDLSNKFRDLKEAVIVAKPKKGYYIVPNLFWDAWFQKIFAQIISVKLWVMVLITILLKVSLITNVQFISVLGIIMGFKGAFEVADVWTNKDQENNDASRAMKKT